MHGGIVFYCDIGWYAGDFPDVNRYRDILGGYDLSTFPKLKEKDVRALEDALSLDIPQLVKQVKFDRHLLDPCQYRSMCCHMPLLHCVMNLLCIVMFVTVAVLKIGARVLQFDNPYG